MKITSKEKFRALFMEFYNPLCNFVNNMMGDPAKSEDIVQEVFLRLWEKRAEIEIREKVSTYLFQAAKNKAIEIIRKEKVEQKHLDRKMDLEALQSIQADKESEIYRRLELLNNSIRQLPPKCREVFVLNKLNGLTYTEIAEHLDISSKTVENHMMKALKILRNSLNAQ